MVLELLRRFYETTRLPIMPLYGGFPVKLRTHIGHPIKYDPSLTPEALALKVCTMFSGLRQPYLFVVC